MTWIECDTPTLCARCGVEQPIGARMAQFQIGPVIQYRRCADCEIDVAHRVGAYRFNRQQEITKRVEAEEQEAHVDGATLTAMGHAVKTVRYEDLPDPVKEAHRRATGEE